MRRAVSVLAIVVGVGLIAFPLAYSVFSRTEDLEQILDRFEFLTLGDNPERYLAEAELTREGSSQLVAEAIPALAAQAGVSRRELEQRFPALARAQREVPRARAFSVRYSKQLDSVKDKFDSVYDVPVSGLPLTATPWLFVIAGVALIAAGAVALRTAGTGPIAAIALLGLAMAVVPLAASAPQKAVDGEDVKDFAENGLTARAGASAQRASVALDAVVEETDTETLPYLARRQGVTERQLERKLAADHAAAARFLGAWDVIGPNLARLADAVSASVDEFQSAKKVPIAFPVWLVFGAGIALTATGWLALVLGRRKEPAV